MATTLLALTILPVLAGYLLGVVLALDMDKAYAQYLLIVPLVYIMGSIPWGYMITRVRQGVDIREYGSGRIGTSNVLRTAGLRPATLVLALDCSKGVLAVLLARVVADTAVAEVVAGLVTLAGHNWSPFLRFKGGRGIATGAGSTLVISPISLGIGGVVFVMVTLTTRYLSLGSLIGSTVVVVVMLVQATAGDFSHYYLIYSGAGGLMIFWQHRDNVRRLLRGTERRMGQPAKKLTEPG